MNPSAREPVAEWRSKPCLVRGKSVYEKPDESDGLRILATQYWPRGISRQTIDEYLRLLAPSRELLHGFKDRGIAWSEFQERYRREMSGEAQRAEIHRLAKLARSRVVTIMCVCKEPVNCHRALLCELIERFDD